MNESTLPLSRREAISRLTLTTAAFTAASHTVPQGQPSPIPTQPTSNSESFWKQLRREQFLLPNDRIFLNNGSLGVTPRPVLSAMTDYLERAASLAMPDVPRWGYETLQKERTEMGSFLGCSADDLAFTHNCTEAMSIIANGLDLNPGDEVLLTDQEHGSGIQCWKLKAARVGISVKEVKIPTQPIDPDDLVRPLIDAIGPRTKVISFSGITTKTGLVLPVKKICDQARERGVTTVIDGAHMNGQVPVNLADIGCDFYAGSPHKWLFAPAGCGLLYGREGRLDQLHPAVVTGGWDNRDGLQAARFMMIGTNNRVTIEGMMAGLQFLRRIGESAVYARLQELSSYTRDLAEQRDYLEIITPSDTQFYQAMVTVRFHSEDISPLMEALKQHNFVVLGGQRFRISCHIHTRISDLDLFFSICDEILA